MLKYFHRKYNQIYSYNSNNEAGYTNISYNTGKDIYAIIRRYIENNYKNYSCIYDARLEILYYINFQAVTDIVRDDEQITFTFIDEDSLNVECNSELEANHNYNFFKKIRLGLDLTDYKSRKRIIKVHEDFDNTGDTFSTITLAIADADDGDFIEVLPGNYNENVSTSKNIDFYFQEGTTANRIVLTGTNEVNIFGYGSFVSDTAITIQVDNTDCVLYAEFDELSSSGHPISSENFGDVYLKGNSIITSGVGEKNFFEITIKSMILDVVNMYANNGENIHLFGLVYNYETTFINIKNAAMTTETAININIEHPTNPILYFDNCYFRNTGSDGCISILAGYPGGRFKCHVRDCITYSVNSANDIYSDNADDNGIIDLYLDTDIYGTNTYNSDTNIIKGNARRFITEEILL